MSGKVPDDPLVPNHPLIRDDCLDRVSHVVLGKVPNDRWVPDDPLVHDDQLIRDDCQGGMCRVVSGKVLDNH